MLNGVGAVIIIPKAIGIFIGTKELSLRHHGIIYPLSGCIAVEITDSAILNYLMSASDIMISLWPNSFIFASSSSLCFFNCS